MKPVRWDPRIIGCYLFQRWEDDRWDRLNQVYHSPPIFNAADRRWHFIAVTFGVCEIGDWGLPPKEVSFPVRNLNGPMDEFSIRREPLSGDEIVKLHELGTPNG